MSQFLVIRGGKEAAPPQGIEKKQKITVIRQHICTNQYVRDSILRLSRGYSDLHVGTFRKVADLANTTEEVVYSVVSEELRAVAPPSPAFGNIRRKAA